MPMRTHQPEQSILDYRKQQQIRNAPFLGMAATAMTGIAAAYLGASLGVHNEIGRYAANFFPDYVAKPFLGLPVYSPLALGKAFFAFKQYPMMDRAVELALGITAVPTLAMGVWQFVRTGRLQKQMYETDLHGSAHWATKKELEQMALLPPRSLRPARDQTSKRVCYVGGIPDEKDHTQYLQHAGAEHIICFAPTRSGKGVGLVLPTLLGGWQESVVVHDIKGENYLLTAGWRQSIGQTILKFNPGYGLDDNNGDQGTKAQCCHFNPLEEVRVGTPFEVKDVMNIATMIVDPDGKGLNDHWQKTGFALLTSVILHVLYAEKDKTLRGVAAFLNDPALQNVDEAFTKMTETEHNPSGKFDRAWRDQYHTDSKVHPVIAQSAKEMLNKAANEKSGVISTMMSFLSLYRDPIVAEWTEYSDWSITDLQDAEKPVSLYLVTSPEDKNRLKPLIRLVLNLIASKFTSENRLTQEKGRMVCIGKHPLLLLLDEFPSLGKMDIFQDAIAFFAGYNVKLFLITQSKSQLEDEGHGYGKAGGSVIIENCHVRIFYAPNDVTTAEWLSKTLGKKTVPMENTTQSLEGSFLPSPKGQSRSITWQARDLLTPDEVLRLRGPIKQGSDIVKAGDMIVMVSGFAPVYGRQILYFKNTVFLERAQKSPPAQSEPIRDRKNYRFLGEHGGVLAAKPQDPEPGLDDMDFADEMPAKGDVAEGGAQDGQSGSTSLEQLEAETTTVEEEEEAATGEVQGDLTQDREVLNVQKDLARLAEMLPPEIKAASGGEDAWRPNATRLDRHEDRRSMDGLLGGKAS
ncbi:type IV secretory system conjugative DNA transfer family protein [Acidithiobacillus ferrooxidans]|uniref:type IV secretory system conjugative DNA transfer family protein n=2 Tax=Acidithiobacillus TaxID=119977 RepID=UPI000AF95C60